LLEKINANDYNRSDVKSPTKASYARKRNRNKDYEGYSNTRKDEVNLILSTLDNKLRDKKHTVG